MQPQPNAMIVEDVAHSFPESLTRAIDAYRDRCRRGGDSTPERVALEVAIGEYAGEKILGVLNVILPERPADHELLAWVDEAIATAVSEQAHYAEMSKLIPCERADAEWWAREARMLRIIRERIIAQEKAA